MTGDVAEVHSALHAERVYEFEMPFRSAPELIGQLLDRLESEELDPDPKQVRVYLCAFLRDLAVAAGRFQPAGASQR